jgi:acyl-CoA synthetase
MRRFLTLHHPAHSRSWYERGIWRADTFYALALVNARTRPTAFALRDCERRLTWQQLVSWADAVADFLHEKGLVRGDRVSLLLSNRAESAALFLACSRNGYVFIPALHRNFAAGTVLDIAERMQTRLLILEEGFGATSDLLAPALRSSLPEHVVLPAERSTRSQFPALGTVPRNLAPIDPDPDRVSIVGFTSGTTGAPKGVLHSDNTVLANARDLVRDWGHGPQTVLCCLSPISHLIAWIAAAQMLLAGGELVMNDPPSGASLLDWILATGATYVKGVPTHAIDILQEQRSRGLTSLGAVKIFYLAGSQIPRVTAEALFAQGVVPQNVYGMTENLSHCSTRPDDGIETILETVGRAGTAYEIGVFKVDDRDTPAAHGETGEIAGRGACMMLGYYADQVATENSYNRDGWFMSGDLGRFTPEGSLQIVGRVKDIIIRGGHNIHPAQIEELAMRQPGISKAAAFGLPDARLGERICLAIVPSAAPPRFTDVLEFLRRQGLSKYDLPEFLLTLAEMPTTHNGKILKRRLVEMVTTGAVQPEPAVPATPAATATPPATAEDA